MKRVGNKTESLSVDDRQEINPLDPISGFKLANLVEQIANVIEQAILNGTFKMGHQLVEQEIAKRFETSRQPIREAFRILENRGLVTVVPRKGTQVATITWADFEQLFPVIAALDGLAGRIVYGNIDEDTLHVLEETIEEMVRYAESNDIRKYLVTHVEFHTILNRATGNRPLIDTLLSMRTAHSWFIMTHMLFLSEKYKNSIRYHHDIVDGLREKKLGPDGIEKLMRDHVLNSIEFYRSLQKKDLI